MKYLDAVEWFSYDPSVDKGVPEDEEFVGGKITRDIMMKLFNKYNMSKAMNGAQIDILFDKQIEYNDETSVSSK